MQQKTETSFAYATSHVSLFVHLILQHILVIHGGYVLENFCKWQDHDAQSSDLMGKMGLGAQNTHKM